MFKFQLSASPFCTCGSHNQTAVHILQNCPLCDQLGKYYWLDGSTLHSKLYGARDELQTMVDFIMETVVRYNYKYAVA